MEHRNFLERHRLYTLTTDIPQPPSSFLRTTIPQKFAGVLLDLNGATACIQIFIQKNGIFFDNNYEPSENLKYGCKHGLIVSRLQPTQPDQQDLTLLASPLPAQI